MKNASKNAPKSDALRPEVIASIGTLPTYVAPKIPAKVALTGPALTAHLAFHRAAFNAGGAMRALIASALAAIAAKVPQAYGQEPEAYAARTMMAAGMAKPTAYASVAAMRCYLADATTAATLPVEGLMLIGAKAKREANPAKAAKAMMATARRNGGGTKACKDAAKGDQGTGTKAPDYSLSVERERLAGIVAASLMGSVGGDPEVAKAIAALLPKAIDGLAAAKAKADEAKAKDDGTADRIAAARKAKSEGREV